MPLAREYKWNEGDILVTTRNHQNAMGYKVEAGTIVIITMRRRGYQYKTLSSKDLVTIARVANCSDFRKLTEFEWRNILTRTDYEKIRPEIVNNSKEIKKALERVEDSGSNG